MASTVAVDFAALSCGLFAGGAHVLVPWRVRGGSEETRRRWALWALPLWLLGALLTLARLAARPDVALATGWTASGPGPLWRAALLLFVAVAAGDSILMWSRGRIERAGWLILSGLGCLALASWSVATGLSLTPRPDYFSLRFVAATACVAVLALAAGEVLTRQRPLWAAAAVGALILYVALLEPRVLRSVVATGDVVTAGAAALLLAIARWAPPRLRRGGQIAATLLAAFFLARVAWLAALVAVSAP